MKLCLSLGWNYNKIFALSWVNSSKNYLYNNRGNHFPESEQNIAQISKTRKYCRARGKGELYHNQSILFIAYSNSKTKKNSISNLECSLCLKQIRKVRKSNVYKVVYTNLIWPRPLGSPNSSNECIWSLEIYWNILKTILH